MIYQFENFSYDYDKGIISKARDNFKLTKTQKKLLNFFLNNPNKIHSKNEIMERVWGSIVTQNSVDQIIVILRSYIETDPKNPEMIVTHFGQGLCFEAQVPKPQETNRTKNNNHKQVGLLKIGIVITLLFLMALWVKYSFMPQPEVLQPAFSKNNSNYLACFKKFS